MDAALHFCVLSERVDQPVVAVLAEGLRAGGWGVWSAARLSAGDERAAAAMAALSCTTLVVVIMREDAEEKAAETIPLCGHPVTDEVREVLAARLAADGASWPWQERLDALDALGRLGDPRLPDPRTLTAFTPETGWVQVEKGSYAVGGDNEASGSLRKQKIKTPGFYIRTWPVTVQEFAAFAEQGWDKHEYWTEGRGEEGEAPADWFEQKCRPNRPVTSVSWYAARAFCRWAQTTWSLPAAGVLDLPTSREWEIAARRGTGRVYPWGGNDTPRVLRGGAWRSHPRYLRAAYRLRYYPGDRVRGIGFRLVVRLPNLVP